MNSAHHGPLAQSGIETAELVIGLVWYWFILWSHETMSLFASGVKG